MKRISIRTPLATALAIAVSAVAAAAASGPTVKLANTDKGKILVTKSGATVYVFLKDSKNKDTCAPLAGCTSVWPLVTSNGKPIAGPGVSKSKLGTIKVGGKTQVTYAGHPLYTYSAEPKGTSYVGISMFGAKWDAITASGKLVK
jgi:predicted lipoprotein with Yx(FWY)xxD motif